MKKMKIISIAIFMFIALATPTFTTVENPQEVDEPTIETIEPSIEILDFNNVSAGVHEVIQQEPKIVLKYTTNITKVCREPKVESVVGLVPVAAEVVWLKQIDEVWDSVMINDIEYFIQSADLTAEAPVEIVTILNIEPTHDGIYFVNEKTGEKVDNPNYISLGVFRLTAYCPCAKCCGKWANDAAVKVGAIGVPLVQGVSIAVDPRVIPYLSSVYIDGHEYIAHDCGGAIKGNRIDMYFEDHDVALQFGVQYKEVFIWIY